MDSLQYSANERNHYFYGKLMTARDFEDEQTYHTDKRRLGNRLLHGTGIVSGLGVLLVDNQTFSLEAGMALDYLGREIVVREPSVKRLSVIPGYDEIEGTGDVYLGIRYREELSESTFSAAGVSGENGITREFNRIQEGYELFLTTREPNPDSLGIDRVLYDMCRLYQEDGITLTLQIPRYVNTDDSFRIRVLFEKRDVSAPVRFSFRVESDMFKGPNGEKAINVDYEETEVTTSKELTLDYTMTCGPVQDDYTELRIPVDSFHVTIGKKEAAPLEQEVIRTVEVTVRPLRELVTEAYYTFHFDELLAEKYDQAIYLARIHIIASPSSFFMERIVKVPFHQYLPNVQLLSLMQNLEKSPERVKTEEETTTGPAEETVRPVEKPQNTATGVETVLLGMSPKVGRCYFSHEFIHGLGAGAVCVQVAAEHSESSSGSPDTLVFGDGVFARDSFSLAPPACAPAAMVNVRRGTLQLGLKLLEKTDMQSIRLRWWAWKPESGQPEQDEIVSEVQISITPNTVTLEPLQQIRFTAAVDGSAVQEVNWSVVEKHGGSIDRNGLYTAPASEGVFEVQAQSVRFGLCRASAYVVVTRI